MLLYDKENDEIQGKVSLGYSLATWYKLKRCSKKECWKQYRYVKFKDIMTKWPIQPTHRTTQKHVEHHDATDI